MQPEAKSPFFLGRRLEGAVSLLPKTPLVGLHYPETEEQIGRGVGQNARTQAPRAVGDDIVKRACDERCQPIRARVTKGERKRNDRE